MPHFAPVEFSDIGSFGAPKFFEVVEWAFSVHTAKHLPDAFPALARAFLYIYMFGDPRYRANPRVDVVHQLLAQRKMQ
jgi:hypothetical protein